MGKFNKLTIMELEDIANQYRKKGYRIGVSWKFCGSTPQYKAYVITTENVYKNIGFFYKKDVALRYCLEFIDNIENKN